MSEIPVEYVPVDKIRVVNPRTRNKVIWKTIVGSIESVGLKKPITISKRSSPDSDGKTYDLVCGQGRLEAFIELGETAIPAIVTEASPNDRHLMSLIENIARRPPSNKSIYFEVKRLRERGYTAPVIAQKLALDRCYIADIVRLVECGEAKLTEAVEAGRLPITIAIEIATGSTEAVQRALIEGYESGRIHGPQMRSIRKLLEERSRDTKSLPVLDKKPLTGPALVRLYKHRVREQQRMAAKADVVEERLLAIGSAFKTLLKDEDLITLLRAEALIDIPEQLSMRIA